MLKIDDIMYRAFLVEYKVIGQCYPDMSREERFIKAILATSDDKWERAKRLNRGKIDQLNGNMPKTHFSDALFRPI